MDKGQQQYTTVQDDEITLRDLILRIQDYFHTIKKKWWMLLLAAIIMSTVFVLRAWYTDPLYTADMTFTVANSEKGGGGGGVSGILGQFGIGSVGGGSGLNTARVLELAKSMEIVGRVLMKEGVIKNDTDIVANHIMDIYEFQEEWGKKNEQLLDFRFTHNQVDSFTRFENSVYKRLYRTVTAGDDAFLEVNHNELSGIFKMNVMTISEPLSFILLEEEYELLSEYFIEKTVAPQQQRYDAVRARLDSLTTELQQLDYRVARSRDQSLGIYDQASSVRERQLQREQQLASIAYTEVKRNVEAAEFALSSVKPVFQIIDEAMMPLTRKKSSLVQASIIGAILGLFIIIIFLVVQKIIQDSMKSEE
ncbi:MAG: hypothetical protein AAGI23_16060 [Bacteroidota bacterium]